MKKPRRIIRGRHYPLAGNEKRVLQLREEYGLTILTIAQRFGVDHTAVELALKRARGEAR